jgi:tetratricopeptide (TPR) repeat protein
MCERATAWGLLLHNIFMQIIKFSFLTVFLVGLISVHSLGASSETRTGTVTPGQAAFRNALTIKTDREVVLEKVESLLQIEADNGNVESLRLLGFTYWQLARAQPLSKYDSKIESIFEKYLSIESQPNKPVDSQVVLVLGWVLSSNGKIEKAANLYRYAIEHPENTNEHKPTNFGGLASSLIDLHQNGFGDYEDISKTRLALQKINDKELRRRYEEKLEFALAKSEEAKNLRIAWIIFTFLAGISLIFLILHLESKRRVRKVSFYGFEFRVFGSRKWYSITFRPDDKVISVLLPNREGAEHLCPSTLEMGLSEIVRTIHHSGGFMTTTGTGYTSSGERVTFQVPTGEYIPAFTTEKSTNKSKVQLTLNTELMRQGTFRPGARSLSINAKPFSTVIEPIDTSTAKEILAYVGKWKLGI